jgi:hypothetical protein
VAERDLDQRLRHGPARLYLAAVRRLDHAMLRMDNCGIPMDPGPGTEPLPWTPEQRTIIRAVASVFREVIERRMAWYEVRAGRPYRSPARQSGRGG